MCGEMKKWYMMCLILLSSWYMGPATPIQDEADFFDLTVSFTTTGESLSRHSVRCARAVQHGDRLSSSGDLRCLPSVIIAGTQKSGTTALSALLSEHPYIKFAPRKEVHFFDRTATYQQGLSKYLKSFPIWKRGGDNAMSEQNGNENVSTSTYEPKDVDSTVSPPPNTIPLYAESTPFYLASRHACRRIAADLPNTKIIVLLRDPISRAYSEYQMKRRRIAQQTEFFDLLRAHKRETFYCMVRNPSNLTAIHACLPSSIGLHPYWSKLSRVLLSYVGQRQNWWHVMLSCFRMKGNREDATRSEGRSPSSTSAYTNHTSVRSHMTSDRNYYEFQSSHHNRVDKAKYQNFPPRVEVIDSALLLRQLYEYERRSSSPLQHPLQHPSIIENVHWSTNDHPSSSYTNTTNHEDSLLTTLNNIKQLQLSHNLFTVSPPISDNLVKGNLGGSSPHQLRSCRGLGEEVVGEKGGKGGNGGEEICGVHLENTAYNTAYNTVYNQHQQLLHQVMQLLKETYGEDERRIREKGNKGGIGDIGGIGGIGGCEYASKDPIEEGIEGVFPIEFDENSCWGGVKGSLEFVNSLEKVTFLVQFLL